MNVQEFRKKTIAELNDLLSKATKDLSDNQINVLKSKQKNVKKGRFLKREIAQIKTVLNEKRIIENA